MLGNDRKDGEHEEGSENELGQEGLHEIVADADDGKSCSASDETPQESADESGTYLDDDVDDGMLEGD